METEYPMPQTFDDAKFWIEIAGYEIIASARSMPVVYVVQSPDGDIFYTGRLRILEAAKRIWYNFYNVSELKAFNP